MANRRNTLVCSFDPSSLRITTCDIHKWVDDYLWLPKHKVSMILIDGIKWQVYIKMVDSDSVLTILRNTGGQAEYLVGFLLYACYRILYISTIRHVCLSH